MNSLLNPNKTRGKAERTKKFKVPSPVSGNELYSTAVVVNSADIETSIHKSPYNTRSQKHLSLASVLDIFPEIKEAGANAVPAIGYKEGGMIYILAGMRRAFCVSQVEGGKFHVHLYENLTEEEKRKIALRADEYSKPTKVDLGFSIVEYQNSFDKKVTVDDVAKTFEISKGQASEVINFTKLPKSLFELFPSLESINYKFLREILKAFKEDEDNVIKVLSKFDGIELDQEDTLAKVKARASKLESEILKKLKPEKKGSEPIKSIWDALENMNGVKATKGINGSLALKFTKKILTQEKEKRLLKFIQELQAE